MPGKRVRMLFIGNSFTTKNDLPTLLSAISKADNGITIEYEVISAGGASLHRHWNAGANTPEEVATRMEQGFRIIITAPAKSTPGLNEGHRLAGR